ncbi:mechanosensitive ion channel family protein [Brevundimonas nasdae]|uniref:Small-conductance mechanosensitive channel n=1 Tax=Brevundimonas nasdae TaxID=172043 RepID=A0ABX8TIV0_9CAUL|nr:mechanosensitive ion channel family protein [Brevundimonas nasdae]QYC11116.1 mechanosensitive ion channel family protein [Brevundimonas nasdae]QYC13903.1 mechanosensitive ion channel family protein [Brevundimonas nasdae]
MFTNAPPIAEVVTEARQAFAVDAAILAKLTDAAGDLAINLSVAALIFVATIFASKWASGAARRALSRVRGFRHDPTVLTFAVQVVRVVVIIIGMIAVLQRLGVQTTSIIAVLGAASLAVGLALQGTLSNVASGIMLLVLRPYRVGDVVDVGGMSGTVQRLDLFTTQLSNSNNHKIVIPNSKVLSDPLTNITGQKTRRIEIKFGVGYGDDLNKARNVLAGVASAHPKILKDPEPWTGVTALLDSSVQITLHAWVNVGDWWQAQADIMQGGKEALDAAGIDIPYPHQVAIPYENETSASRSAPTDGKTA